VVSLPVLVELKLASGQEPSRRKDLGDAQELIKIFKLSLSFREKVNPSLRSLFGQLWREVESADLDE
jgi:hypothetical protein